MVSRRSILVPKAKHIIVHEGDYVQAGEPLMEGTIVPNDILAVLGVKELAKFLVNEIQEVYRLQGVKINDKHIEVIVRQMLKRVMITSSGDSRFMIGEQVEWWKFEEERDKLMAEGKTPAVAEPLAAWCDQGLAVDGKFYFRCIFPGNNQGAHQCCCCREDR